MEMELAPDVIKATQASLGKYVKRPQLTEKLLRKPPFRFLHDIVSTVNKTTGFFNGLFEEDELISENVKDRESKILFLNKVISVIGTTTGKTLTVKSSKIVAGQEPDKTNELLQCLALALDNKLSSSDAVKKCKENMKIPVSAEVKPKEKETSKITKKSNDNKKLTSKSSEKLSNKKPAATVDKNDSNMKNDSKSKRKESIVKKNEIPPKKPQQSKSKNTSETNKTQTNADVRNDENVVILGKDKNNAEKYNENEDREPVNIQSEIGKPEKDRNDLLNTTTQNSNINASSSELSGKLTNSYTTPETELNPSITSQDLIEAENSRKDKEERPTDKAQENIYDTRYQDSEVVHKIETESTTLAKKIEPQLSKDESMDSVDKSNPEKYQASDKAASVSSSRKNSDAVRPHSVRPSSSRPGAPRLREKIDSLISDSDNNLLLAKVNIIAESSHNEDEEDASVIVVEQQTSDEPAPATISQEDQLQLSSNEHGHLVQQILDSHKDFSQVGKTEIEWQFGVQKVKDAVNQEIEQLRFNIQAVSRVANPLGKLLDHIQEDAEVMRQELQQWTNTYEEVSKEMQKQKIANEETLEPLQTRIKHLNVEIQEKHDKIVDLKILIHKNSSRIEQLLKNGKSAMNTL